MTKHMTKLSGALVLMAGTLLCFPQAADALTTPTGPPSSARTAIVVARSPNPAAATLSPITTVPVGLIPPIVIHPSAALIPPLVIHAANEPADMTAPLRTALPLTGTSHVLVITVMGLCLIGLGVLVRRGAVA